MSRPIIEVENLSKLYKLGLIGATTLQESLRRRWCRVLRREEQLRALWEKDLMIDPDDPRAGPEPNTFWALRDLNFTVEQGEIVGIIGKNGAGKSTLLKILSHITEPTTGRATIRGRVGSLLEVGTGFHPELTGRENIYLNGAILGMKRSEISRKFVEIVEFSEIERFIDTPVKRYSSGMFVRLAFSVAAHLDPEVVLVDEVLAVGDAEFQKKCLGKLREVTQSGKTVLFISHYMHVIRSLCSRVVLMDQGRIETGLSASEAISRYLGIVKNEARQYAVVGKLPRATGALGQSLLIESVEHVAGEREDEPIVLRLNVDARRDLSGLLAGVYVQAPGIGGTGVVGTAQCSIQGTLQKGSASIDIEIPAWQLAPGNYILGFIIRDRLQDYDDLREFFPIRIEAAHKDMGGCEHWHETWGAVRIPATAAISGSSLVPDR